MAYPIGGRADKYGNRYEYNWTINKLLDVIDEDILSITLEAIGEEEQGIDLWIKNKDKSMEGQQCKGRNSSKESWTFSEVSKLGILSNWKKHLNYSESNKVSIVSPICFTVFEDLTELSRNTDLNKPEAFVDKQVFSNKTGRRTKNLFVDICRSIDIDYTTPSGKIKAQQFFSRMYYRQVPDSTLKDLVLRRIDLLFANEKYEVYGKLLEILLMEDILGKEIDIVFINKFIEDRGIKYLDLSHDERIVPAINKLNKEYHKSFIPLKGGLIQRTTFEKSRELLERGESIIIHGNAGTGKSGCTEVIINYCINNSIPYLAIKLDKHIPEYNSKKWGETLGLPASIAQCINAISNDRRGVLILDQLDAIRWTQVHTGDALLICDEIIDEVRNINLRRKFPLSIVFVCRTYDFESDRSIASLFKSGNNDSFVWNKIKINTLDQKTVEKIVGSQYQSLSSKLKNLLSVFSNLYIWEQLDDKEECLEINTTYGLIHKWWEQIVFRARRQNFDTSKLENLKNQINQFIDRQGRLFVPTSVIDISPVYLDFLKSNGFITDEGKKIAFVHQSITDCFLSDIMIQRHFNGDTVLQILGDKAKQTPSRRYQLQLFLQQLAEYDIEDFLVTGEAILKENGIRYNLKYVPLEVIAQLSSKKDSCVFKYIIEKLEEPEWNTHFLNNVVTGKKEYIRYLREKGILKNWMEMKGEEQERVILLMSSIAPDYNRDDIQFIEEYALKNKMWYACFYTDIHEGSDEYFELRMRFYRCFPDFILRYININKAMKNCEIRTIRMIALMIELSVQNDEQRVYSYTEDYISDKTDYCISNYLDVFKYLWPLLPDKEDNVVFKNWSLYQMNHKSLERLCTNIVKKALRKCAVDNSDLLIEKLRPYLGCGNDYYNELILDSFKYLPTDKADFVVSYLMSDFNKRGFERTSGNKNKLLSLQQVIKKHAEFCSDTVYEQLEDKVIHFVPDNSKDILKRRIEFNREKNRDHVYCDYWGDFQYEIIQCFPEKRKSEVVRKLWITLLRRRGSKQSIYAYDWPQGGGIRSPIDGKKLSNKSWKQIINNQDISDNCKKIGRFKKGFFIENTINEFAASFQRYVYDNPIEALKLLIENNYYVNPIYIDSAWSGLSNSEMIDSVPNTYIELLIKKYGFNMSDFRARDICSCIERKEDTQWSDDIYQ